MNRSARNIASIYLWEQEPEPMVMVFDAQGGQVCDLQGPLSQVKQQVLSATDERAVWYTGQWRQGDSLRRWSRTEFARR